MVDIWSTKRYVRNDLHEFKPFLNEQKRCTSIDGLDESMERQVEKYCKRHHLRYSLVNQAFTRGSSYRRTFFSCNKGIGGHYFCAYCGRLLPKAQVTVDHIVPIAPVKSSKFKQWLLKRAGIENINCEKNLAAACRACNSRKGTSSGAYSIAGWIGKVQWLWIVRHVVRFSTLSLILFCLFSLIF